MCVHTLQNGMFFFINRSDSIITFHRHITIMKPMTPKVHGNSRNNETNPPSLFASVLFVPGQWGLKEIHLVQMQ